MTVSGGDSHGRWEQRMVGLDATSLDCQDHLQTQVGVLLGGLAWWVFTVPFHTDVWKWFLRVWASAERVRVRLRKRGRACRGEQRPASALTRVRLLPSISLTRLVSLPSHFCTWTNFPFSTVIRDCRKQKNTRKTRQMWEHDNRWADLSL